MKVIVSVSPFRCRVSALHARLEECITEQNCRDEIQSILEHGQLVPVLGRPVRGDPDFDVELICGARRLFVARHINVPLLVELRDLTDRAAMIAMDIENRQRKDLSPYERSMCYARWLRTGHFKSQEEMARAMGVSASSVSRLLKLARLPAIIVDAFGGGAVICEGWGSELVDALEDSGTKRHAIRIARAICLLSPRPSAREVFRRLMAAREPKPRRHDRDDVVKDKDGRPLFRIRYQRSSVALILPSTSVSTSALEHIRDDIVHILESAMCAPREKTFRHTTPVRTTPTAQNGTPKAPSIRRVDVQNDMHGVHMAAGSLI